MDRNDGKNQIRQLKVTRSENECIQLKRDLLIWRILAGVFLAVSVVLAILLALAIKQKEEPLIDPNDGSAVISTENPKTDIVGEAITETETEILTEEMTDTMTETGTESLMEDGSENMTETGTETMTEDVSESVTEKATGPITENYADTTGEE